MNVADPRGPQFFRKGRPVELRVVSRSGDAAYIDDALDAVRPQKIEERFPCAVRMPNRQDSEPFDLGLSHDAHPFPYQTLAGNEHNIPNHHRMNETGYNDFRYSTRS